MSISAKLSVSVVVRNGDRFAMVRKVHDDKLVVDFPSGFVESQETLYEAMHRMLVEHTGIEFQYSDVIPVSFFIRNNQNDKDLYVEYLFETSVPVSFKTEKRHGFLEVLWLTKEEIMEAKQLWGNNFVEQKMLDVLSNIRSVFHFS